MDSLMNRIPPLAADQITVSPGPSLSHSGSTGRTDPTNGCFLISQLRSEQIHIMVLGTTVMVPGSLWRMSYCNRKS